VARTCSLILIVLDVLRPLIHKKILENELEGFGIRLNKQPPNIHFKRKEKGGINLQIMVSFFKELKKILSGLNLVLQYQFYLFYSY